MAPILLDDELRLVTLTLLHERPREFTELREALRVRFGGDYNVASSVLSRLLHDLERDGSVTLSHGATNLYSTTIQGEAEVTARVEESARITGGGESVRARADAVRLGAAAARDELRASLAQRVEREPEPKRSESEPKPPRDLRFARGELAQRVEAVAQRFRMQVRAFAREADASGRLTPETVASIESQILELQNRITDELGRK